MNALIVAALAVTPIATIYVVARWHSAQEGKQ